MQPALDIVNQATRNAIPNPMRTSPALWAGFSALHKVHRLWRTYRRTKVYSNPDNFLRLMAGHAANFAVGDSLLFRVAAQCVLISTRILECAEQQRALQKSWDQLVHSFRGTYVIPAQADWGRGAKSDYLSPSTISWWNVSGTQLAKRAYRVAVGIIDVGSQAFQLSMKIMDAVEVFTFNPETGDEAMNELFVNGSKWMDQLVDNKELLISSLEGNRGLISKILEGTGANGSVDDLIGKVRAAIGRAEEVRDQENEIAEEFGMVAAAFGKKALYGVAKGLGLAQFVPVEMLPPPRLPVREPQQQAEEQYPEEDQVSKFGRQELRIPARRRHVVPREVTIVQRLQAVGNWLDF